MIRVIGGTFRGRKLKAPKGLTTRPVMARVREALFTILGDIGGFRVLDLYAGTGAVGIEALSRGAGSAVFVESANLQCSVIRENLRTLGVETEVIRSDAVNILKVFGAEQRTFDFIFADPPYEKGLGMKALQAVCEMNVLSENGIMVLSVRKTEVFPEEVSSCRQIFNRRYGDTRLIIYALREMEQ